MIPLTWLGGITRMPGTEWHANVAESIHAPRGDIISPGQLRSFNEMKEAFLAEKAAILCKVHYLLIVVA